MTAAEYAKAFRAARARIPTLTRSALREIQKAYQAASVDVAKTLATANPLGLEARWAEIMAKDLAAGVEKIQAALEKEIPGLVEASANQYHAITEAVFEDIVDGEKITTAGVRNMLVGINEALIVELVNREWQDGYKFSARVWDVANDYDTQIKRLVTKGFASGQPAQAIAKDIEKYTKGGLEALGPDYQGAKWGPLLVKRVDWRALRLTRSELWASMQSAGVQEGLANPAADGWFDWILQPGRQEWNCDCAEIAAAGPYRAEDVPGYRHPNDACSVQPRLRNLNEFKADLKTWLKGGSVPYIQEWYQTQYQPAQIKGNAAPKYQRLKVCRCACPSHLHEGLPAH